MVGLVSPEMIQRIGSYDKLTEFLVQKKVTHLVVLRNWFQITNQTPLYQTDEEHPEIVEIFPFDPVRTHFTPVSVGKIVDEARMQLNYGNLQSAGPLLEQAVQMDSLSSRVRFFLGVAYMLAGNYDKAKSELNEALRLYPEYWKVYAVLADIAARQQEPQAAVAHLETLLQHDPGYAEGYRAMAQIYQAFHLDSAKALQYSRRYQELSAGVAQ